MRRYSKFKFFLRMIPALLGWAALMLIIWGFIFLRLTDTTADKKLVIYADADISNAKQVMVELEDLAGISKYGWAKGIFTESPVKMIKLRPFTYDMMNEDISDGDIYIITESKLKENAEMFAALPESLIKLGEFYELDGKAIALKIDDPSRFFGVNIHYYPNEGYWLGVNATSPHAGEGEHSSAYEFARQIYIKYMLTEE